MRREPLPQIDAHRLLQAISSFAGRVSATDDPKLHQKAAQQLRQELRRGRNRE
jgi:hypothetical protein